MTVFDGDGMTPHKYKRYWDSFETGNLEIGTHYYEPDGVEYISYLWSDIEGVKTHRNISVGSAEEDILSAYPEDLYYVDQESASPGFMELRDKKDFNYDYAYTWQPFTAESNDIRDITFYIKEGKVVSIEMISPFELRYVYGYDREAGLQYVEEQRKN